MKPRLLPKNENQFFRQCLEKRAFENPNSILLHALHYYCHTVGTRLQVPEFFSKLTRTHVAFARNLIENMDKKNFNFIFELNKYLEQVTLNKDGNFFKLLIAYFHHFKSVYSNLSQYPALKKQIIIPLSIFEKNEEVKLINELINNLNHTDPCVRTATCLALSNKTIPSNKLDLIISKLLALNNDYSYGDGFVCEHAWRALAKFTIPEHRHEEIVLALLATLNDEKYMRKGEPWDLFKLLKKVTNVSQKTKTLIQNRMMELATNSQVRFYYGPAWEILDIFDFKKEEKIKWINSTLERINFNFDAWDEVPPIWPKVNDAIYMLRCCTIPEEMREVVLTNFIEFASKIRDLDLERSWNSHRNSTLKRTIISALGSLPDLKTHEKIRIFHCLKTLNSSESYSTLNRMGSIPSEILDEVISFLMGAHEPYVNWDALVKLANIQIPEEFHQSIVDKLLQIYNRNTEAVTNSELFAALGCFPKCTVEQRKEILSIYHHILDNPGSGGGWFKHGVCDGLIKMQLSLEETSLFIEKLVKIKAFKTASDIAINKLQRELIVNHILEDLKNVNPRRANDMLLLLLNILRKSDSFFIIQIRAQLELSQAFLPDSIKPQVRGLQDKLDYLITIRTVLEKKGLFPKAINTILSENNEKIKSRTFGRPL